MEENGMADKLMPFSASPDLNPNKNVWANLKDYDQKTVKPRTNAKLVEIKAFWGNLNAEPCCKYIDHIQKVIPHVVILNLDQLCSEVYSQRLSHLPRTGPCIIGTLKQ